MGGAVTVYKDRALRIHSLKSQDRAPIELLGFRNERNQDNNNYDNRALSVPKLYPRLLWAECLCPSPIHMLKLNSQGDGIGGGWLLGDD